MSRPSKPMLPPCGAISPARSPISVVLPAPFGPMTAWHSPCGMSSAMASAAITPPNRLPKSATCSSGSVMAWRSEQALDAAVQEDRDQEQRRAEEQSGILGDARQRLFEQQIGHGAEHRTEQRPEAAEDHHDHQVAGAGPEHHGRT